MLALYRDRKVSQTLRERERELYNVVVLDSKRGKLIYACASVREGLAVETERQTDRFLVPPDV